MTISIQAEARSVSTKSANKQIRMQGKTPASVFGERIGNASIAVETKELLSLLRSNPHAVLEMDVPQLGKHPVMIHEVQRDTLKGTLLHIDFHQINMNEPVKTTVTIEFVGEPKGVDEGGILQVQMHEIEIKCLPDRIPASFSLDISSLDLGENLLVSDITIPEGIELKSDLNDVVVTILAPQKDVDEDGTLASKGEADVTAAAGSL